MLCAFNPLVILLTVIPFAVLLLKVKPEKIFASWKEMPTVLCEVQKVIRKEKLTSCMFRNLTLK